MEAQQEIMGRNRSWTYYLKQLLELYGRKKSGLEKLEIMRTW